MIIPAVMFIEMALDVLKLAPPHHETVEKELQEFRALGARLEQAKIVHAVTDAERGYLIGLYTARALLSTMPAAVDAKVTL